MHIPSTFRKTVVPLLCFTLCVRAQHQWMIDEKCNTDQTGFIRLGMTSAMAMADAALKSTRQQTSRQQNMILWMFGNVARGTTWINDMFNDQTGIRRLTTEVHSTSQLHRGDVKFYCNEDRLEARADGTFLHDTEADALFPIEKMACRLKLLPTLAYVSHLDEKFFMITFCPWFLDYAMRKKFQFTNTITDVAKRAYARYLLVPGIKALRFKKIDALALFDKVIIHELTHARFAEPGVIRTVDVGGEAKAYGWTNCRELSTVQSNLGVSPPILGPEHNADTYAMFATACLLYFGGIDGLMMELTEDGDFHPV